MDLVDRDTILADIEKRYEYWKEKEHNSHSVESEIRMSECQHLLLLVKTIRTKEVDVDFEREMKAFATLELYPLKVYDANVGISITMAQLYSCAKHFLKVGFKMKKDK